MDPTAPKNKQNPQSSGSSFDKTPQAASPIQPGQFVVAGEEDGVFKEPPAPAAPTPSSTAPAPQEPEQASSQLSPLPAKPPSVPPSPGFNLSTPNQEPPLDTSASNQLQKEASATPPQSQPDPTPYVAPQPGSPSYPSDTPGNLNEPSSLIKKLRMVAIIIVVLLLLSALIAVAWFFVLKNRSTEQVKTENTDLAEIEEPSPLPKRTAGGFSELPVATSEAEEATPQAE